MKKLELQNLFYLDLSNCINLDFENIVIILFYDSALDCSGALKPKGCIVETFLDGPKNVGGSCPSPTHKYRNHCCCESGCCWEGCNKKTPPQSCLNGVPNSQWVKNPKKDNFIAVRNWKG